MHASISSIEYHLPSKTISTRDLALLFPNWSVTKVEAKTGISNRAVAGATECASDLAIAAAIKLFDSGACKPAQVDFLLLCTQSPDYALPTTACLLQDRLGIPTTAGALDFNLGCSGFVYGLGIAEGLIASRQARSVLLLTAETYSKYISPLDKGSLSIFGDGAAATLLTCEVDDSMLIGPFVYGTNGAGGQHLIVKNSGSRKTDLNVGANLDHPMGYEKSSLFMDGNKIFQFAIEVVPRTARQLLSKAGISIEDVDLFVFHQANAYLLEEIRKILDIPKAKMYLALQNCGNTVSSTIPIALKLAESDGRLRPGDRVMLAGFGVGYSWAATLLRWTGRHLL